VIAKNGISSSIDLRYYFSSKALYTLDFFKSYCEFVLPVILSVRGKAKKALILDCDNTLWKGIIGEDGFDGIKMSGASKEGVPFEYVQSIAVNLSRKGVIIGLNSKNNAADVDAVVLNHKDQVLKQENIVIKKVNWQDKVSNLKEIASDLNIGADSFIMVDDSDFEVNFIRESLPHVNVVQVPANGYLYPFELIAASQYFFNMNATAEDLKKGEMYKQQAERDNQKAEFENIEDYLKSLELTLTISENNTSHVERIAQLTQKTNQFNLTTQRYTETEISNFMQSGNHMVFVFALADKFGDYGITGIAIVELKKEKKVAVIDSMLMSCRVIGRNVEFAFLNHILKRIKEAGIETVTSSYNKTIKNDQVKDFYDKAHFKKVKSSDQEHLYETKISDINFINIPYLNIQLQ
jgi:FkbH-like protein